MKIHISKKITLLDEIKEIIKNKNKSSITSIDIKNILLKLLEKEGIKIE